MEPDINLSEVMHDNWLLTQNDSVANEAQQAITGTDEGKGDDGALRGQEIHVEREEELQEETEELFEPEVDILGDSQESVREIEQPLKNAEAIQRALEAGCSAPPEKRVFVTPAYNPTFTDLSKPQQQVLYYPGYASAQGFAVSSTYHQPFMSMVRKPKTAQSALANALQRPSTTQMFAAAPVTFAYIPSYPFGYAQPYQRADGMSTENNGDEQHPPGILMKSENNQLHQSSSYEKKATSSSTAVFSSSSGGCSTSQTSTTATTTTSAFIRNHQNRCFELPENVLDGAVDENSADEHNDSQDGRQSPNEEAVANSEDGDVIDVSMEGHENGEKLAVVEETENKEVGKEHAAETHEGENVTETRRDEEAAEGEVADRGAADSTTSSAVTKYPKSELEALLMQPVKKHIFQEYQPSFVLAYSTLGTQPQSAQQSSKTMQFYQPPAQQHLARSTPPPGFASPYGMSMRPHEEETRQIMNLDNQQAHNSSPTSSWNQPYPQMTNLNAYQPRAQSLYAPQGPPPMVHQNGPPGVVPPSNPYYQQPPVPPHHHMQPQAPMMAPGMHGQQQQPYYNTQSPLTGTPPSMNYGTPQMPAPQTANGNAPIFNFSKPRNSNEGSAGNGGGHRRKKQNELSSPRYNNNSEDVDASVFPDMADFPLLDVVQSKAKKDAGRKPCRPHLCEQSRMLISRVCHFQREFIKRLPARHPLASSPFSKPDQWTSQMMGISLATVRKCVDMAVDEEVFTRCTDKNLVNLTPSERAEREELLSKLSTVFEDEKSLGAGTAGLTIAEYSPRRSYSNTLLRQSTDDKSSNSSYAMNGAEFGSSETTLLNLDDHSNSSKDFGTTPTPSMDLNNGGPVFEELGTIGVSNEGDKDLVPKVETPKRGRPRKAPGAPTTKNSKRKASNEDSEVAEDKDEHDKKTEDEDETNEETEKKPEDLQPVVPIEREDDAASSEGTNRSESATPEPVASEAAVSPKKVRATRRKKRGTAELDEDYTTATKKKRGSVTSATAGIPPLTQVDDENAEHKMVTRARSRQP
ncbi:unnamed protein product [Caenorhabditis sp. 36 PRJEB53466]|nr:unnamed protein product [Caenorhabditis sp. 36 PRJEB53466]